MVHSNIIPDQDLYYHGKRIKPGFCDYAGDKNISSNIKNSITTSFNKEEQNRVRIKDKQDRATVDQVLDPRTLSILHKWLKNNTLTEIFGSVSTGKEANVYYAYRKPSDMQVIPEEPEFKPVLTGLSKKERKNVK